jgi:hypothetical protein
MLLHGEWKWDAEVDQQQLLISAATQIGSSNPREILYGSRAEA